MRLNVVDVSSWRFFPLLVADFTNSDEFHSLKNTFRPCTSSHFWSRWICVDLPEPSRPSTAMSRPGNLSSENVLVTTDCESTRRLGENQFVFQIPANAIPARASLTFITDVAAIPTCHLNPTGHRVDPRRGFQS